MARPKGKGKNDYSYELFFGLNLDEHQEKFVDMIFDKRIVFCDAVAGSGKTTLAIGAARILNDLHGMECVYIFAPVQEQKLGFRPGSTSEKERDYVQPLYDALIEINENPMQAIFNEDVENLKFANANAWVRTMSHTFLRGTNLKNKVVIIDECQNFTLPELRKVLTRISDDCKVICIGNGRQCDLNNPATSGFHPYMNHFEEEEYCGICELVNNYRGQLAQHADEI